MHKGSGARRGRLAAVATTLAIAGGALATAGEAHLYIAPYGFSSSLTGDGQVSGGSAGTDFDLEDTLGIDPDEAIRGIDVFVKLFGSRIDFGYNQGEYSGRETLESTFVFNGVTFSSSEDVATDVDFKHYRLMYGFDFGLKVVNIGFLVGGHLIDVDARVKSTSSGIREQEDLRAPIPAVGVSLGVHPIPQLAIHAQVSGLSLTISDIDATLIDGFAGVHYLFVPRFGVVAGYRYFKLDVEDRDEENRVDVTQRGPYAGLALHL